MRRPVLSDKLEIYSSKSWPVYMVSRLLSWSRSKRGTNQSIASHSFRVVSYRFSASFSLRDQNSIGPTVSSGCFRRKTQPT